MIAETDKFQEDVSCAKVEKRQAACRDGWGAAHGFLEGGRGADLLAGAAWSLEMTAETGETRPVEWA